MPIERFTIERNRWYAWTMYPGYGSEPYSSPIYIYELHALGNRRFEIHFLNAGYAEGVQPFTKVLRTLSRRSAFIFCEETASEDRGVVIYEITVSWMHRHYPEWTAKHAPNVDDTDLQQRLSETHPLTQ